MTSPLKILAETFSNLKVKMYNKYSEDAGKMLLHMGTLGTIFASAAHTLFVIKNDKITGDQKKFLIPQEILDGTINILSFYLVTNSIQNFTKKLVSSGKILTPSIRKFCMDKGIKLGEKTTDIGKTVGAKISELQIKNTNNQLGTWNDFKSEYSPFESGAKVLGNLIGAILSCNIIVPMLKNPLAAIQQKRAIEHEHELKKTAIESSQIFNTTPRQSLDDYRNKIALNPTYSNKINSGMKI